jgi:DHA1 family inner membrane transport protein
VSHVPISTAASPDARWRSRAAVLAIGTFAVGTDAFVVAGLLPPIADSLHVTVGQAGQLVTVFALAYAISAPLVGFLTAGWPLRRAVIVALLVFSAGNAMTALAPTYSTVLASRAVAAVGAALYTASATSSAAALAGEARRGRAIAIVMLGLTSSLVLGTPLGTVLGAALHWRATLWLVTALGMLASVIIALRLPLLRRDAPVGGARLAALRDGRVRALLAITFIAFLGIYLPYTYFSAVYAPSTGGDGNRLALLLLAFGLAGTAGNLAAGALADRFGPSRVIVAVTLLLAVVFAALPVLQGRLPLAIAAAVVSGGLSFAVTTPQQHLVIAVAPVAGTALYQSVLYLAISASGAIGAVALQGWGGSWIGPLGAVFVLAAGLWSATRPGASEGA